MLAFVARVMTNLLGSSSIEAQLLMGLSGDQAPESILVARLLDLSCQAILTFMLVLLGIASLRTESRYLFVIFAILQLLTGMSNHPVSWMPLVALYLNDRSAAAVARAASGDSKL